MVGSVVAWLYVTVTLVTSSYVAYRFGSNAGYLLLFAAAYVAFVLFERYEQHYR